MVGASSSLKEHLKKYQDGIEEENKKKKKKKVRQVNTGVLVVDEDPVWQKPVKIEEEEEEDNDSAAEEKPQGDEDIEVKRMKRLEQLKARRPFGLISEDGSGWVSISDRSKTSNIGDQILDISPPRRRRADTPSLEHDRKPSSGPEVDLSPPRKRRAWNDTPSPEPELRHSRTADDDSLPPHRYPARNDSPSPEPEQRPSKAAGAGLSPPRQRHKRYPSPLEKHGTKLPYSSGSDLRENATRDVSPHRRRATYDSPSPNSRLGPSQSHREFMDLSRPLRQQACHFSPSPVPRREPSHPVAPDHDLSPPRPVHQGELHGSVVADLSPPGKGRKGRSVSNDLSARQVSRDLDENDAAVASPVLDLSPPRKDKNKPPTPKQGPKTGLVSGQDIKREIAKTKKEEWLRFKEMDPSISGRGAEPVYRDKETGERISKEELLKSQKKDGKTKV